MFSTIYNPCAQRKITCYPPPPPKDIMTINVYKTRYALCNGGQMQNEHVVTKEKKHFANV
jgi:hypothetical protein